MILQEEVGPQAQARWRVVVSEHVDQDLLELDDVRQLDTHAITPPVLYWEHPDRREALLAVGSAQDFVASGAQRFETVGSAIREVLARLREPADMPVLPRVVGGFAFAPQNAGSGIWEEFPSTWFFLPRRLWLRRQGRCFRVDIDTGSGLLPHVGARPYAPHVFEGASAWRRRVDLVLDMIARGEIEKLVLSRQRRLHNRPASFIAVLRALRDTRPSCVTFACKPATSVFLGSTPEVMVRRTGTHFSAPALAGTTRRGRTAASDRERGLGLLASAKIQREHAAVVDGIRAALQPLALVLDPAGKADVLTLPEALHLLTPVSGQIHGDLNVLQLAAALHPTAAVCGTPRAAAARYLQHAEAGRGWFTGGIGWMDADGDGEIDVALRSALATQEDLLLFAGAGIVRGSDAASELDETEAKMDAVLGAFEIAASGADVESVADLDVAV